MQDFFSGKEALANSLVSTMSEARLTRYLSASNGSKIDAMSLYHWNNELSRSMYFPIQIWEITLRNKMNTFLERKYGPEWPYDKIALRQLNRQDARKIQVTKERQQKLRGISRAQTGSIVADLSAGFWVSLLSESYNIPFRWEISIRRVFAHDVNLDRNTVHRLCLGLLHIRNRIAHHEPIFHLPLSERRNEAARLVKALCPSSYVYLDSKCDLEASLAKHP